MMTACSTLGAMTPLPPLLEPLVDGTGLVQLFEDPGPLRRRIPVGKAGGGLAQMIDPRLEIARVLKGARPLAAHRNVHGARGRVAEVGGNGILSPCGERPGQAPAAPGDGQRAADFE